MTPKMTQCLDTRTRSLGELRAATALSIAGFRARLAQGDMHPTVADWYRHRLAEAEARLAVVEAELAARSPGPGRAGGAAAAE